MEQIRPILRWAGGKQWLTKKIEHFLPFQINNYFEPFAGGCSVYFHLKEQNRISGIAHISDINENLINFYKEIKNHPDKVISQLKQYKNTEEFYYLERGRKRIKSHTKAAQFLFFNRTSFNGIYRENLKGEYNVPYGHKKYKTLFEYDLINSISENLKKTILKVQDFEEIENQIKEGDLVFFDPPYTVAHENNGFVKYNQKIFSWEDQIRLKSLIERLDNKKVSYILTNAKHDSIINLYKGIGESFELSRSSQVGGKGARRMQFKELLITNII